MKKILFAVLISILFSSCINYEVLYKTTLGLDVEPTVKNVNISLDSLKFKTDYFRGEWNINTSTFNLDFENISTETIYIVWNQGVIIYPDGTSDIVAGGNQETQTIISRSGLFRENITTTNIPITQDLHSSIPIIKNTRMKFCITGGLKSQLDDEEEHLIFPKMDKNKSYLHSIASKDIGRDILIILPIIINSEKIMYIFRFKIVGIDLL